MSRYIDAKWLQDKAYKMNFDQRITERELALVNYLIGISKPIDIVRCVECKYKQQCRKAVEHITHEPTSVTIGYKSVEWCSYGERSE